MQQTSTFGLRAARALLDVLAAELGVGQRTGIQSVHMTNSPPEGELIGVWELERSDVALGLESGSVMMFLPSGELRYASQNAEGGLSVSILTFRVERDLIITNQASAPREERTRYRLIGPNHLELTYDGGLAVFARTS